MTNEKVEKAKADAKKRMEGIGKRVADVKADAEKKAEDKKADIKARADKAKENIGKKIDEARK